MPCRWSRHSSSPEVRLSSGELVEDWMSVRRGYLRHMRKQTRWILILMALIEALKYGPLNLVFAGKPGWPAVDPSMDYGIAYTTGCIISYIYLCVFMVIWVPFFSWWVPPMTEDEATSPGLLKKLADYLNKLNMIILPLSIGFSLGAYLISLASALIYVDSLPLHPSAGWALPKFNKKNNLVRVFLLTGIALALAGGYAAFQILEHAQLAHVKTIEYVIIVVPVQINIGLLLGSAMQFKMEKRIKMKEAAKKGSQIERAEQTVVIDEKTVLIEA